MTLRVALVGTNFGAAFLPIWQAHPLATCVAVCQRDEDRLAHVARRFGIDKAYPSYGAVLADRDVDAIHLCTPVPDHARQSVAALLAGKHVLCSVPLALTLDDLLAVVAAQRSSGRVYMLAETAVYGREFAYVDALVRGGALGRLQFAAARHIQNTQHAKEYWQDVSPMLYSSHVAAPLLDLVGTPAVTVACMSSHAGQEAATVGNAFQSCLVSTGPGQPVLALTRGAGRVSRPWVEGFALYGDRASFEWPRTPDEPALLFSVDGAAPTTIPDHGATMPAELRPFTRDAPAAGMHGGSYAPIVHDFVSAIRTDGRCRADLERAAAWTMVGLAAQESSDRDGRLTAVPTLEDLDRPRSARRP